MITDAQRRVLGALFWYGPSGFTYEDDVVAAKQLAEYGFVIRRVFFGKIFGYELTTEGIDLCEKEKVQKPNGH